MNEQEIKEKKAQKKDQGLFGQMGGTQKALLLIFGIAIFFIIWSFIFGGITNIYQLIAFMASFLGVGALFYGLLFFIQLYFTPEYFSPKKDYFNRLVNLAIDLKPNNVHSLYFQGSKDKKRVKAGKIVGLLGIPYFVGKVKVYGEDQKDKDGKLIAKKGSIIFKYSFVLKRKIPQFEKIEYGEDGDTLFIYESGWFFFKRRHYLRCHKSLHGDLNGDVEVYDINCVPYGTLFEFPFKQLQSDPARIMLQSQMEVILATHDHQSDLISQGVDSAVYFNPYFRLLNKQNAEVGSQ